MARAARRPDEPLGGLAGEAVGQDRHAAALGRLGGSKPGVGIEAAQLAHHALAALGAHVIDRRVDLAVKSGRPVRLLLRRGLHIRTRRLRTQRLELGNACVPRCGACSS